MSYKNNSFLLQNKESFVKILTTPSSFACHPFVPKGNLQPDLQGSKHHGNHINHVNHSSDTIRLQSSLRSLRNSLCSLRLKISLLFINCFCIPTFVFRLIIPQITVQAINKTYFLVVANP